MPVVTFRAKITLLLCSVVLVLGLIAIVNARRDISRILGRELDQRGEAIASDLAANAAELLLSSDLVGLYEMANRAKINNPDVRYVLIVDSDGVVRVNTFGEGMPEGMLEANVVPSGLDRQLRRIGTEEGVIRDVAIAVLGGTAGIVRVGMSDESVKAAVAENTRTLIVLATTAVAVSLVVAYWLGFYMTRPLAQLVAAVQRVTRGDLSQRIRSPSRDEVGQLGRSFNLMASELESKESARRALMRKVISSQEDERKRVARELHDELAQRLSAGLLALKVGEGQAAHAAPIARQSFQTARQEMEGALVGTRKLISDLRPTVLDDLGLVPAIRTIGESYLRPAGTTPSISASNLDSTLPPEVEIAVFRIVQEAMANIAKHADAKTATIALRLSHGVLLGVVTDDGRGFHQNPAWEELVATGGGVGLQGMEERAGLLGGALSVVSGEGLGTTVSFSIPVQWSVSDDPE